LSRERAQEWLCKSIGIHFPYVSMGKVDSLDLFGPNELMIFAFYAHNKDRYTKASGYRREPRPALHSDDAKRLDGSEAFEPDPGDIQTR
jgi:hypothetical protein